MPPASDFAIGADTPLRDPKEDRLGREPFVRQIATALIHSITGGANKIVVGLDGPWGSGKSSLLRLIEHRLLEQQPDAVVLHFDPWIISSRDDLVRALIVDLAAALEAKKDRPGVFGLAGAMRKYAAALEPAASAAGGVAAALLGLPPAVGAGAVSAGARLLTRQQTMDEIKGGLEAELDGAKVPIVVLIDEIDRLERAEVKAMAQAVRAVADFPRVAYVLAYDGDRVAEHLGDGSLDRGRDYLQKIVQVPFQVPMPTAEDLDDLLDAEVRRIVELQSLDHRLLGDDRYLGVRKFLTAGVLETLRDVKRLLATFQVEAGMVGREVDWRDLLGFIAFRLKRPDMAARVRAKPDAYVQDPIDIEEQLSRGRDDAKTRDTAKALLGKSPDEDRAGVALGRLLFPRVREGSDFVDRLDWTDTQSDPERICHWYPLTAVTRLGSVRGFAPRPEIDALLSNSPQAVCDKLTRASEERDLANSYPASTTVLQSIMGMEH